MVDLSALPEHQRLELEARYAANRERMEKARSQRKPYSTRNNGKRRRKTKKKETPKYLQRKVSRQRQIRLDQREPNFYTSLDDIETVNVMTLERHIIDDVHLLPCYSGVYFAIDHNGIVRYVGKSLDVQNRWVSGHHKAIKLCRTYKDVFIHSLAVAPENIEKAEDYFRGIYKETTINEK